MRRTCAVLATASLLLISISPGAGIAQDSSQELESPIFAELWLGGGWPIASTNVDFDPSLGAGARVEMQVSPLLRGGVELAFHSFDAELPAIRDNQGALALSIFGKLTGVWGPYRPFALAGFGAANSKRDDGSRLWDLALQIGGGAEAPISDHVSIMVGTTLHVVPRGGQVTDLLWMAGYFGFVFKQP